MDLTSKVSEIRGLFSLIVWITLFFYYGDSKYANKWENLIMFFITLIFLCVMSIFILHQISNEYTIEDEKGVPNLKEQYLKIYLNVYCHIMKALFMCKIIYDKDIQNKMMVIGMFIFSLVF